MKTAIVLWTASTRIINQSNYPSSVYPSWSNDPVPRPWRRHKHIWALAVALYHWPAEPLVRETRRFLERFCPVFAPANPASGETACPTTTRFFSHPKWHLHHWSMFSLRMLESRVLCIREDGFCTVTCLCVLTASCAFLCEVFMGSLALRFSSL